MSTLVLTSRDHYSWDRERAVTVSEVLAGPEPGSTYARLLVDADQPDGPMDLAVRRRDGGPWRKLMPGDEANVLLWRIPDPQTTWGGGTFVPPHPRPDAWCTVIGRP